MASAVRPAAINPASLAGASTISAPIGSSASFSNAYPPPATVKLAPFGVTTLNFDISCSRLIFGLVIDAMLLLLLDAGVLDQFFPQHQLVADERAEFFRRAGERVHAERCELRLDLALLDDLADLGVKPRHDFLRRVRGREITLPGGDVEIRHAGFLHRRQVRYQRRPVPGGDRQRAKRVAV